jgi:hypothetical protein
LKKSQGLIGNSQPHAQQTPPTLSLSMGTYFKLQNQTVIKND